MEKLTPEQIKNLMSRLDPDVYEAWLKRKEQKKLELPHGAYVDINPTEDEVNKAWRFVQGYKDKEVSEIKQRVLRAEKKHEAKKEAEKQKILAHLRG